MLWIVIALILFILQIAAVIVVEFRRPHKAIAWLVVLFLFPPIGFVLHYFVAKEYCPSLRRKEVRYWDRMKETLQIRSRQRRLQDDDRLAPFGPVTANNEATVYSEGEQAFEAMLDSIAEAEHHIHIEFYIVRDDRLGARFERLLVRKAQQGVKVRFIYDGIGSRRLGKAYLQRLRDAGVETGCFFPIGAAFFAKRLNYRNHRKIIVIDGKIGFFGGLNIGDEYLGSRPKTGYWRDTHYRVKGDAVLWLQYTFLNDWCLVKGQTVTDAAYFPVQECHGNERVQIVKSGPDETIIELIFTLIVSAKKRIYIETPYFVPDPGIMLALKTAIMRGVDVRVILPGIPDKYIVYCASLSYAKELMRAGVRFYGYKKGFVHAKVMICDDLACSGSANMDIRSFCGQFEINAIFYDENVVGRLVQDFYRDLEESEQWLPADIGTRNMQRLGEIFARLLSALF
ncbi:cardiolipin synthase [Paenibacillus sp. GYB003]|uniref:cardiolipin synthase n=1 Tax=Paenibacillus sp. GYB003 TaxID=2994392 RepID=UPI002F9650A6